MSEKISFIPEGAPENQETYQDTERRIAKKHEAGQETRNEHRDDLEAIIKKIEHEAKSSKEVHSSLEKETKTEQHQYLSMGLKNHALKQNLNSIQHELRPAERIFSKLIHKKPVDVASNAIGNTIARPSGLLVGSVCSLATSLLVIFICRYYGYEYNYLLGIVGFGGGFVAGLIIEMVLRSFRRK